MKTDNLVNGYVLTNLFYELMFLDEYGVDKQADWSNRIFVDDIVRKFVATRFETFTQETKSVVRNTLRYLLSIESENSEIWSVIWQASSAPVPTPLGVRNFVLRCHDILFDNDPLPRKDQLSTYRVIHDMQVANRLN